MNYEEARSFLEDTRQYGSRLGLDTIRSLMRALGDAQERVPVIHIGGTNGKGSVGAMLSAVFTEAGYKVGWFNSPDVFTYEEEFRICGEPIARERLAQIFTEVKAACDEVTAKPEGSASACTGAKADPQPASACAGADAATCPHPTRFEVETAAAYRWFYEEQCDLALIEVGMGGATDATNLVTRPLVSVLTSIGRDHMHTLGQTLPEIARAKAGIIKPGCPVVTSRQEPEVMDVIRARCAQLDAPLYPADRILAGVIGDGAYRGGACSFLWNGTPVTLGLHGPLQAENAACALEVVEVLRERDPERFAALTDRAVARGLAQTRWPGRYERIRPDGSHATDEPDGSRTPDAAGTSDGPDARSGPILLLDGAHNEAAAQRLREALDADFPGRRIVYIMGVLADKDFEAIARIMFRPGDRVYTVTTASPRALSARELAAQLARQGIDAVPCETAREAVTFARNEAGAEDVILTFGSLYCLGEIREAFSENESD